MDPQVAIALIGATGVVMGSLGGVMGAWITARYTASLRIAILEHERACKNIPPLIATIQLQSQKMETVSERIDTLLLALPKRKSDL